jgi:hypothetical protein
MKEIEIYQSKDNQTQVAVRFEGEPVWLSQKQMAELFDKDVKTINEHIKNIFAQGELEGSSTIRKNWIVQIEASRRVNRKIDFYNLDIILSAGYRVNSKMGTRFRIWATQRYLY